MGDKNEPVDAKAEKKKKGTSKPDDNILAQSVPRGASCSTWKPPPNIPPRAYSTPALGYSSFGNYGFFARHPLSRQRDYEKNFPTAMEHSAISSTIDKLKTLLQFIQSLVDSLSSITGVFDAVYNSIHRMIMAVLTMIESLRQSSTLYGSVFSLLSLFKFLDWLIKKFFFAIGLMKTNPETELAWHNAVAGFTTLNSFGATLKRSLSFVLILGITVSAPFVFYKLFKWFSRDTKWDPEKEPGITCLAMYTFYKRNHDELSFSKNECLIIAPAKYQKQGIEWVLAMNKDTETGLIPRNYVKIVESNKTLLNLPIQKPNQFYQQLRDLPLDTAFEKFVESRRKQNSNSHQYKPSSL